jgi:hypothetical protein
MDATARVQVGDCATESPKESSCPCPSYEEALKLIDSALEMKRMLRRQLHSIHERLTTLERPELTVTP